MVPNRQRHRKIVIRAVTANGGRSLPQMTPAGMAPIDVSIVISGHTIPVTDDNRQLVEFIRDLDAERAYEDAAFGRPERPRIAV
jgi:hypothetical protein